MHTAKKRDSYQPRKTVRIRWTEVAATTAVTALFVAFAVTAYNLATDEPQPSCDEAIAAWGTAEETRVHARYILACNASDAEFMEVLDSRVGNE